MQKMKFEAIIDSSSVKPLNSEFTLAKCYVMYYGENRNGNSMSKEAVLDALPTIYNVPVIGEFIETVEDFGTHGGKIEISDKGIKYIQTTKPFGVVSSDCNPRWEMVEQPNGEEKEYLVVDVVLWSGRYEELNTLIAEKRPQSMEISVISGDYNNETNVYDITKFQYSALCILGADVEACFEKSQIMAYSIDSFKTEMDEFMTAYKQFSTEETASTETVETVEFIEEPTKCEKCGEIECACGKDKTKSTLESFSATYKQRREALSNALDCIIVKDSEGNLISETYYYVEDFTDDCVYVEKSMWTPEDYECTYGRFTYSMDETTLTAIITSEFEQMIKVWLTIEENAKIIADRESLQSQVEEYRTKIEEYMSLISDKDATIAELETYKAGSEFEKKQEQVAEVLSEFETVLNGTEEFKALKEKAMELDIETLEKELYALVGRVKFKANSNKAKKTNFNKVSIDEDKDKTEDSHNEYGQAQKYIRPKE